MSTQADVLNLLADLQQEYGLTYVFTSHNLAVVAHVSDMVAVTYLGRFVEVGMPAQILHRPRHPYTQALLSAEPVPLPSEMRTSRRIILEGEVPLGFAAFRLPLPHALPGRPGRLRRGRSGLADGPGRARRRLPFRLTGVARKRDRP